MQNINEETREKLRSGELKLGEFLGVTPEQYGAILLAGHTLFTEGRLIEAKKIFEGMAALDSRNPYIHGMLAAIYQKEGNDEAAIARYSLALRLFPKDIQSRCNRAELLLKAGRVMEAADDLKAAIELDPDHKHPAANRARLLAVLTAETLQLAKDKGMDAVREAKHRIDTQLHAS